MNWPTVAVNQVAPEQPSSRKFDADDVVWHLSLDQIETNSNEVAAKRLSAVSQAGTSTYVFDDGNVLYSKLRPYLNKVVVPDEPGVATTELIPLRPDPHMLDREYLGYYLRSPHFVAEASTRVAGAKMPRVRMSWLRSHEIPLPPPSEQRRIVEILDQADGLRQLRRDADAKAARILPALFLQMFGDPATNPMRWPTVPFDKALKDCTAGQPKFQRRDYLPAGLLPVVDQGQQSIASYCDNPSMKFTGSLPVILFGDHTRTFKFVDHTFVLGADGVRVLKAKAPFNPVFLYWHCRMADIPSAGYSRHFKFLREKVFLEPPPALQNRFADLANVIVEQIDIAKLTSGRIESLLSILLSRAFSGKLTAKWRQAHMQELLIEMQEQARLLNLPLREELESAS